MYDLVKVDLITYMNGFRVHIPTTRNPTAEQDTFTEEIQ